MSEFPTHTKKKEKRLYYYLSGTSLRGTAKQDVELNPLDFYLWGHLRTPVYSAAIENEDTLYQSIFYACQTILNLLLFERAQQSMIRRVPACISSGRGEF
jgi:hypothetical protein